MTENVANCTCPFPDRASSNFLLLSQSAGCKLNFKQPANHPNISGNWVICSFPFLFSFGTFLNFLKVKFASLLKAVISCKRALTSSIRCWSVVPNSRVPTPNLSDHILSDFQTDVDIKAAIPLNLLACKAQELAQKEGISAP